MFLVNLGYALGYCLPAIVLYGICVIVAWFHKMPFILYGITAVGYLIMFVVNSGTFAAVAGISFGMVFLLFIAISVLAFILCMKLY